MVIVKTFMYRSHLDQISSSVDTSSAPCAVIDLNKNIIKCSYAKFSEIHLQ